MFLTLIHGTWRCCKKTTNFLEDTYSVLAKNDILFLAIFLEVQVQIISSSSSSLIHFKRFIWLTEVAVMFVALEEWRMRKMERAKQRGLGKNATITLQ